MIDSYINQFSAIISNTSITDAGGEVLNNSAAISKMADFCVSIHEAGGTIYLVGNGGSSGIVSHSSIDFINACKLRATALTDNSVLTCLANDYGYENVFSEGLKTLFTEKDLLIAVSSSGSSMNIRNAAKLAREKGGKVISFSGFKSDNPLRSLGDYNFWLDSSNYGKVEIGHALLLHILTDEISSRRM